ncbi:hypothetical protein IG631_23331 [Alternaria alternata]|nr:hypothetical protein IG631_23331 [Alternaria alternata]
MMGANSSSSRETISNIGRLDSWGRLRTLGAWQLGYLEEFKRLRKTNPFGGTVVKLQKKAIQRCA